MGIVLIGFALSLTKTREKRLRRRTGFGVTVVRWFGAMVTCPYCYYGSSHHGMEEVASHLMATKKQRESGKGWNHNSPIQGASQLT